MEEKVSVQMTKEELFDFLLYHTYSKFSGFLTNVLGAAVGIMGVIMLCMGKITVLQLMFYLLAATVFLAFTPLQLKSRAKKQMQPGKEYQEVWEYTFSEEGIHVIHGNKDNLYPWEKIQRTVTAPKTIGIYYGKDEAFIIPKRSFGARFVPVMQMLVKHIGPQNVKLK